MFTYVAIQDQNTQRLTTVHFTIQANQLHLKELTGTKKGQQTLIPIANMNWYLFDHYYGGRRFSFHYDNQTYQLFEVGHGVVDLYSTANRRTICSFISEANLWQLFVISQN